MYSRSASSPFRKIVFSRLDVLRLHEWLQPVRRKVRRCSTLRFPKQPNHLEQQHHVQRQQNDMQDEHRVDPVAQSIADERQIAEYRDSAQAQHRAHAERQQHESRRQITQTIDQRHDNAHWK
ncbi:hypothetical protein [Bradyrhizobium elkanii]